MNALTIYNSDPAPTEKESSGCIPSTLKGMVFLVAMAAQIAHADGVDVHNKIKDNLVEVRQTAEAWPPFDAPEFGHQSSARVVGEASGIVVGSKRILTACHVIGTLDASGLLTPEMGSWFDGQGKNGNMQS